MRRSVFDFHTSRSSSSGGRWSCGLQEQKGLNDGVKRQDFNRLRNTEMSRSARIRTERLKLHALTKPYSIPPPRSLDLCPYCHGHVQAVQSSGDSCSKPTLKCGAHQQGDNDPTDPLPPPCLLPLAPSAGHRGKSLMSTLSWTTFTEGKSTATLYMAWSSARVKMSQG